MIWHKSGKITYVDPQTLFHSHGPTQGCDILPTYIHVLASIALYGIKYVVLINESGYIIDGNFRTYAAAELGMKVPVAIKHKRGRGSWYRFFFVFLSRTRKILGLKWLYYTNIKNPTYEQADDISMICSFQKNILNPDLYESIK